VGGEVGIRAAARFQHQQLPMSLHGEADALEQLHRLILALDQIILGAKRQGALRGTVAVQSGQHDHRRVRVGTADHLDVAGAAAVRQPEVHQHAVEAHARDLGLGVCHPPHHRHRQLTGIDRVAQAFLQQTRITRRVLDHQQRQRHRQWRQFFVRGRLLVIH
jgi:hypothetical protein